MNHSIIRNIRHIQIKKIAYTPNLFKAIIIFEKPNIEYDESDDIEHIKLRDLDNFLTEYKPPINQIRF